MGVRAEVARAEGRLLVVFSADSWKFSDLVNPEAAIQLFEAVGLDEEWGVLCGLSTTFLGAP